MQHRPMIDSSSASLVPSSPLPQCPSSQQKLKQSRRHRLSSFATDKNLLHIFLFAVVLVTISIFIMPQNIENSTMDSHHGVHHLAVTNADIKHPQVLQVHQTQQEQRQHQNQNKIEKQKIVEKPLKKETTTLLKNKEMKTGSVFSPNEIEWQKQQEKRKQEKAVVPSSSSSSSTSNVQYHVVFSTGCSTFQDWQSYVFFFHLLNSGQQGHVTRIASGCKDKDADDIRHIFEEQIAVMAPERFHLHLAPDYSKLKKGYNFKYFNKPFGMRHWLQEGLGYPDSHDQHDDTIVILMDPDQILLRPFTNDFSNSSEVWRLKEGRYKTKVEHGSPFAQQYGFGLQWKDKIDIKHVTNGEPSGLETMERKDAFDYYMAMGPPYIATGKDMYAIVEKWTEFVPRIHDNYPHLLAEMFGYNVAAAHLGLKHTIAHSFMVSDVMAGGEGWKLIHDVEAKDICYNFPKSQLPHVIHYCQRYMIGKWFIGKYRLRKDFISCESPLLTLPPDDVALKYDFAIAPDGQRKEYKTKQVKDFAFMVCQMIPALNDAAVYFKDHHCDKETANYKKSYVFHDNMDLEEDNL